VIPTELRPQADAVVEELQRTLGGDLVGVYLHGSAVLGCFGPQSDIDLVAVLHGPVRAEQRRRLVDALLEISAPNEPAAPLRPVELDLVLASSIRTWQYPTPFDFHYGESHRSRFEAGELELWKRRESRDLAAHVTVLRHAGTALVGPPVEQVFPNVPWMDYVDALTHDLDWCRERWAERPRYGVLSTARIWATMATGMPQSKATGAEWALSRLPDELRPVLEHGLDVYTGATEERWSDLPVARYISAVADEIDALTQR
jgi:predicted nucleotidyltransferase